MLTEDTFLPICRADMDARGWDELDVLFVSGDAYIDHPAFGVPLLARLLEANGFRVGVIAQPDWRNPDSFRVMGRPRLFAAISSGAMDSMVNHYTATKRLRSDDAYSPGGRSGLRPNRALIAYTAAVKAAHPKLPVVIGGIEASLRRFAHYDFWDDKIRRSILFDSKSDLLVYGMAEKPLLEIAHLAASGQSFAAIDEVPGTAVILRDSPDGRELPSFEEVTGSSSAFLDAFNVIREKTHTLAGAPLIQKHGSRYLVVNPSPDALSENDLDQLYQLPFTRRPHPCYSENIPAYQQIRFSVTSHRGCCGGCSFCAIAAHQGRDIQSRSLESIIDEVQRISVHQDFKGALSDVGGPTANMYGIACTNPEARAHCRRHSCLYPARCRHLNVSAKRAVHMLEQVRRQSGVHNVPVASGLRYDLLNEQPDYLQNLVTHHVGGLLKIAPESLSENSANFMYKPGPGEFTLFLERFRELCRKQGKRYGVVPYLLAGHPGCTLDDAINTALYLKRHRLRVEQVQIFTPTPGTRSTCMWHTGLDPDNGEEVYVPRSRRERELQKAVLLFHLLENRKQVEQAFREVGRETELAELFGKVKPGGRKSRRR